MTETIELWADPSPASTRVAMKTGSVYPTPAVRNVNRPTLTPFIVDGSNTAFIVCPGGGMMHLAYVHEGSEVAQWCNANGASAYVLEYRTIPSTSDEDMQRQLFEIVTKPLHEGPFADHASLAGEDLIAAIRYVRERHTKVVVVGFSAGARTLYEAATGPADARPDAAAFLYSPTLPERPLDDAPPAFFAIAADDPIGIAPVISSFNAWRAANRPAELHIFERGSHGFGMRDTGTSTDGWIERLGAWLRMHRLL